MPRTALVNTFLLILLCAVSACQKKQVFTATPSEEVWAVPSLPKNFDWNRARSAMERKEAELVMDGLIRFSSKADDKLTPLPCLAAHWEKISPVLFRFHLKPNVLYTNGLALQAMDFVVAYQKLLKPRHPARPLAAPIAAMRAISPLILEVQLKVPDPFLLSRLAQPAFFPWPSRYVPLAAPPTLGPYQREVEGTNRISYVRNPTYHLEPPRISRITVAAVPELSERKERAAQGEFILPSFESQFAIFLHFPTRGSLSFEQRRRLATSLSRTEAQRLGGSFDEAKLLLSQRPAPEKEKEAKAPSSMKWPPLSLQFPPRFRELAENLRAQWQRELGLDVELQTTPGSIAIIEKPIGWEHREANYIWLRSLGLSARSEEIRDEEKRMDAAKTWEELEEPLKAYERQIEEEEYWLWPLASQNPDAPGELPQRPGT